MLRVTARYLNDRTPVDSPAFKRFVTDALACVYPVGQCGAFTQSLMELGATVCAPRSPKCGGCPRHGDCAACAAGTQADLPVKTPKKAKRLVEKTVFLLWYGEELALVRRADNGLLAGMWSFPNVDLPLQAPDAMAYAAQLGVQPLSVVGQTHRAHVFTHIRWEMDAFTILCGAKPEAFVWCTPQQIRDNYALPTAFRIFLEEAHF